MTWKFYGDSKFDIVLSPNDSPDHNSPISLCLDQFEYFFFFDLEFWWGFKIRYCTFPKYSLDHKSPISLFEDRFEYFFSLILKFDDDSILVVLWIIQKNIDIYSRSNDNTIYTYRVFTDSYYKTHLYKTHSNLQLITDNFIKYSRKIRKIYRKNLQGDK